MLLIRLDARGMGADAMCDAGRGDNEACPVLAFHRTPQRQHSMVSVPSAVLIVLHLQS